MIATRHCHYCSDSNVVNNDSVVIETLNILAPTDL